MGKLLYFFLSCIFSLPLLAQSYNLDSSLASLKTKKDSTLHALKKQRDSIYKASETADTATTLKEYAEKEKWERLKAISSFPVIDAGPNSGVVAVQDVTEVPDPNIEYKLLFEFTSNNPDSMSKEINMGLAEAARIINLHVASGIPLKKIKPVIVVHGGSLNAMSTNDFYKKKYKTDNPNLKVISELKKIGARFIVCGQAMAFFSFKKEDLDPDMKISITAQTVLSSYMLKGFKLYWI